MGKYNRTFELSLDDMDVIEIALRAAQTQNEGIPVDAKCVSNVLGKLHNQKTFYRPRNEVYVGG